MPTATPNPRPINTAPNNTAAYGTGLFNPNSPWSLAPSSIQGTGKLGGAAYQNNLAGFMAGLTALPKGNLYINPTSTNPWQNTGQQLGFGNSPLFGGLGPLSVWGWTQPQTPAPKPLAQSTPNPINAELPSQGVLSTYPKTSGGGVSGVGTAGVYSNPGLYSRPGEAPWSTTNPLRFSA